MVSVGQVDIPAVVLDAGAATGAVVQWLEEVQQLKRITSIRHRHLGSCGAIRALAVAKVAGRKQAGSGGLGMRMCPLVLYVSALRPLLC